MGLQYGCYTCMVVERGFPWSYSMSVYCRSEPSCKTINDRL